MSALVFPPDEWELVRRRLPIVGAPSYARPVDPLPAGSGTDGPPLFQVIRRTLLRTSVSDEDDELAHLLADVVLAWQEQDRAEPGTAG
jgi:hypothetical protein